MDIIDGKWISDRLTGAWGEQARLAEAMGIDGDKVSKILKGKRNVQPAEVPRVVAFFKAEAAAASEMVSLSTLRDVALTAFKVTPRSFWRNASEDVLASYIVGIVSHVQKGEKPDEAVGAVLIEFADRVQRAS